ncbi:hypothetical protein [Amycolatopsis sp. NPDC054798]
MINGIAATLAHLHTVAKSDEYPANLREISLELRRSSEFVYDQAMILSSEYGLDFGFDAYHESPEISIDPVRDVVALVRELALARSALDNISHSLGEIPDRIPAYAAVQGRVRAKSFVREFNSLLDLANQINSELTIEIRTRTVEQISQVQVRKTSYHLASFAVRLLPAESRSDYEERFRSELFDLAEAGCGWQQQVRHSLRVLARAPWLRHELRAPTPSPQER